MIPQQEYGSTRIHQKMLLFMVATGDDSMTSTSSKLIVIPLTRPEFISKKSRKIRKKSQKRPFLRRKNKKCHPKGTP